MHRISSSREASGEASTAPAPRRAVEHGLGSREPDADLVRGFVLALKGGWRPRLSSDRTVRTYRFALRSWTQHIAGMGLPSVTVASREHALEWVGMLRRERAPATAQVYVVGAKLFSTWLVEEGEIREPHPFSRISPPARPKRLTPRLSDDMIERLLATQDAGTLLGLRNIALFAVLIDTGLRLAECARIQVADVDWKHGTVRVMGKGSKERVVRLGVAAQRALDRYVRVRNRRYPEAPHLWVNRSGAPLSPDGIEGVHTAAGKQLGIHLHPHMLRHTFGQAALDAGMDRESVRILMGHSGYQTLRLYTEATDAGRALEAHRKHSPLDNLKRGKR